MVMSSVRAVVRAGGRPVAAAENLLADALELVSGESGEEVPGEVERAVDAAPLRTLVDEVLFEVVGEGEVAAVVLAQRGGADDGSQVADLPSPGVAGVELVGQVAVVIAGAARADSGILPSQLSALRLRRSSAAGAEPVPSARPGSTRRRGPAHAAGSQGMGPRVRAVLRPPVPARASRVVADQLAACL
jgi:hypothetical protein